MPGRPDNLDVDDSEIELRLFLVGVGKDPGLERLVSYLVKKHGIPLSIVSYEVYQLPGGESILIRELTDSEVEDKPPVDAASRTVEKLCLQADSNGIGEPFRAILETAKGLRLYPRPFKASLMFAPPTNHTRALFTVWTHPTKNGDLWLWVGNAVFAEFFPVTEEHAASQLGSEGWRELPTAKVSGFTAGLTRLISEVPSEDEVPFLSR
jgi:hypothetical protein